MTRAFRPATSEEIDTARELYASDDVEIDSDAQATDPVAVPGFPSTGIWVQAWVYLPPSR